ncbi:MAG: MBL fold metallo-hydrolase [Alphaproteobacteria bacterium]
MKVRFWGTRGSIAKPGASTVRYGGNTSCVEVRSDKGALLVIDCGTGAHGLGQALPTPCSGHILISHTHWDHIQGLPFFAPLFAPGNEWHIYGPRDLGQSLREVLAGQMEYTYFPVSLNTFAANVQFHEVIEGSFAIGDFRITTQFLNHPALTVGYRIEADGATVVYASDHEPHSREAAEGDAHAAIAGDLIHRDFLRGADLVIHDAQYTAAEYPAKQGWGHSTIEYVTDAAIAAKVRQLALYHHDPNRTDNAVEELLDAARQRAVKAGSPLMISAAAEGSVVTLRGVKRGARTRGQEGSSLADPDVDLAEAVAALNAVAPAQRAILAASAEADHIEVAVSNSAKALLAELETQWPSIVFLGADAKADPVALCRKVRAAEEGRGEDTPVIAVVDQAQVDTKKGQAAGVTDWLTPPFSEQYARTRIRAWLMRAVCRWQKAPLPDDEEDRLASLYALGVLDTPPEERFDRHTRIAAAALDMPVAMVTLVDRERQWFKSKHGLDIAETPRDMSFCAHSILHEEPLIVRDALKDDRFADNPVVVGGPRVRFYAGVPLRLADGSRIGTLCIGDHKPRDLSTAQLNLLKDIARLVEQELEQAA